MKTDYILFTNFQLKLHFFQNLMPRVYPKKIIMKIPQIYSFYFGIGIKILS